MQQRTCNRPKFICKKYTVSQQKDHPFYFCDNFTNCKLIQIIFGLNIAEKICNRLSHDNFNMYYYVFLVYIVK